MRTDATRVGLLAAFVVLAVLALYVASLLGEPAPAPRHADNAMYVWQRHWSPAVMDGIGDVTDAADSFMVLGAEFPVEDGRMRCRTTNAEWPLFAANDRPVWVVLRAHRVPGIDVIEERRAATETLAQAARGILDGIGVTDTPVRGIQLDYDCAAEDLAHYAALLGNLRESLPHVPVSITALPTWLRHPEFAEALEGLDHFVLQVHSLEPPVHVSDAATLCDTFQVPGWIEAAAGLGSPFYVALPTYGYRLMFDASGNFAGLGGEEAGETFEGCTIRELAADPVAIAAVVRTVRAAPPAHWRGFAWFRLPVEGDRLNWAWPVLRGVMNGQPPKADLHAEVRSPSLHLYELWVVNRGAYRPAEPIRIAGDWTGGAVVAHDVVGGFRQAVPQPGAAWELAGPAPYPGEESMVAWFRLAPAENEPGADFHLVQQEPMP